jgi:hypothetical protein
MFNAKFRMEAGEVGPYERKVKGIGKMYGSQEATR